MKILPILRFAALLLLGMNAGLGLNNLNGFSARLTYSQRKRLH